MPSRPTFNEQQLVQLRTLRERGQAPRHGVYVTDSWKRADLLRELGFATLMVKPGEELDWAPMHGLYVLLLLTDLRDPKTQQLALAIRDAGLRLEAFDYARGEFTILLPRLLPLATA